MNSYQSNNNRAKYNTLTPAEAKNLSRHLSRRPPARTASVLNKPRARPLLVTDLDDYGFRPTQTSTIDRLNTRIKSKSPIYQVARSPSKGSPKDSGSNLSYRSSSDIVDSAYGSDRLQTMSVDLGNPSYSLYNSKDIYNQSHKSELSNDSYSSAKSKFVKLESSLSSSTSKVFQNQLFNLKKIFRYLPSRRSFGLNSDQKQPSPTKDFNDDGTTLGDSISQICLNRSQSPPVCPPPPGELKSMTYIESTVNYSNYDEFTRARNQRTATLLNGQRNQVAYDSCSRAEDIAMGLPTLDRDDSEQWQLSSLPLSYERNLTTVLEEKQNFALPPELPKRNSTESDYGIFIKPPERFGDDKYEKLVKTNNATSITNSSQSLTSITSTDSIDYHQHTSSFKYPYAQPNAFEHVSFPSQTLLFQLWSRHILF